MKKLIIFAVMLLSINVNAQISRDLKLHCAAGAAISAPVTVLTLCENHENDNAYLLSLRNSMIIGTIAGVGKESYDRFIEHEKFDCKDLAATVVGAFWGNVATSMLAWDTSRPFYYLGFWKEKKFKGIALTINF